MDTIEFVNLLPASVERSTVVNQLRAQLGDMQDNVLPEYNDALDCFRGGYNFKSQLGRTVEQSFSRQRMTQNRINWICDFIIALDNAIELLPYLEDHISKLKSTTITRDGIDLRTANVLQMAELNKFMLAYAPKLLLWVYASEGATLSAHVKDNFSRAEKEYLTNNLTGFVAVVNLYCKPAAEIKRKLDTTAQIPIAGIDFEAAAAIDSSKTDPLKLGFLGEDILTAIVGGMSYRLGKMWAEFTVKRHNEQKELKTALELRLIEFKMAQEGTADAVLSKRIRYTEDRLQKLSFQISQYEA